jgi:hypothetical protein
MADKNSPSLTATEGGQILVKNFADWVEELDRKREQLVYVGGMTTDDESMSFEGERNETGEEENPTNLQNSRAEIKKSNEIPDKEIRVPPFPRNKIYLSKKGKLNAVVRRHFDSYCLRCGFKNHASQDCKLYDKDYRLLCKFCYRGFHYVCRSDDVDGHSISSEGHGKVNVPEDVLYFRLVTLMENIHEELTSFRHELREMREKLDRLERITGVRFKTLMEKVEQLEQVSESRDTDMTDRVSLLDNVTDNFVSQLREYDDQLDKMMDKVQLLEQQADRHDWILHVGVIGIFASVFTYLLFCFCGWLCDLKTKYFG